MAIFFTDSCQHVISAGNPQNNGKWTSATCVYDNSSGGVTPRWGTGYFINLAGSAADTCLNNIPVANQRDTITIGFALSIGNGSYYAGDLLTLGSDTQGTAHGTLRLKADGAMEYRRGSGSGTVIATSANTNLVGLSGTDWRYVFLKVKLHDTTGTVELWVNGTQEINATGLDTKNAGTKTVFDYYAFDTSVSATQGYCDVVVMDDQGGVNDGIPATKDIRVECLFPSGNGNSSQGTGSDGNSTDNYALVDENPPSTADYVGITTDDQKDTYAMTNLASATGTVLAVVPIPLAAKSDAGAKSMATVVRESGGTEADSADRVLTTSYVYYPYVRETKPSGGAFAIADVNGMEVGFKARP